MKQKPRIKMDAAITIIALVALVCIAVSVRVVVTRQPAISANREKAKELKEQIEYEEQLIKEIDEVTQKVGTDEYTEKIAREKLGMIKTDEIVFIDISGQ